MPLTWSEKNVQYAGLLDSAAQDVLANLDDEDGYVIGTKEYRELVKAIAKEWGVGRKDLDARVKDYL